MLQGSDNKLLNDEAFLQNFTWNFRILVQMFRQTKRKQNLVSVYNKCDLLENKHFFVDVDVMEMCFDDIH